MWKSVFKFLAPVSFGLRLILPLFVFYKPIETIVLVVMLDWVDAPFYYQLGFNRLKYDLVDKLLDFYWYTISLVFAYLYLPFFYLLLLLYLLRLTGQILFYVKKESKYFIYFPNFYEVIFIFILFLNYVSKAEIFVESYNSFWLIALLLMVIKALHEIFVHKYLEKLPEGPEWLRTPRRN